MWTGGWRDAAWARLSEPWDIAVVGGGITGAGILREAARAGLRALLIEARDFAWGTSSRSSKLVHGGLRYLKQGHFCLTRAALVERERLLVEAPGLVDPLGFLVPTRKGETTGRLLVGLGLAIYDTLAGRRTHHRLDADSFHRLTPHMARGSADGGFRYADAQTDDARLVVRVLREAVARGAVALNHVRAQAALLEGGRVCGLRLRDAVSGRTSEVRARAVVNATGAWADFLRGQLGRRPRIRPLRGSHLTFPAWRFPAAQGAMVLHPADRRPLFVIPWEGVTLVGTTDLDHRQGLDDEPGISAREVDYLLEALRVAFPSLGLTSDDVLTTFCGVRPVIDTGKADPSKEARDHVVWEESGLLTVTGGKLTTFRLIARDALRALRRRLPGLKLRSSPLDAADDLTLPASLRASARLRLLGHYGREAGALAGAAGTDELTEVPGTNTLWAELRWAARAEGVVHLDDLLLRRVRLGLLLAEGGLRHEPRIRALCQSELGWDDARWQAEVASYRSLWRTCYALP